MDKRVRNPSHGTPHRRRGQSPATQRDGRDHRNGPGAQTSDKPRSHHDEVWLYGAHAARAALRNPVRKILRVVGTAEAIARLKDDPEIAPAILSRAHTVGRGELDDLVGPGAVHQGVAVLARPLDPDLDDVLERAASLPQACVMVLDQVTDPHNVGAVLRSAAAMGALAVLAPDRGAPAESGTMAKSASGALDIIPYIKGVNLVRMLEQLKEHQFWLVGLDAGAEKELAEIDLTGRIALVVGAEGEGLRRLVGETCDHMAHLPIDAAMESLNVSNAAAVALYERIRQTRPKR